MTEKAFVAGDLVVLKSGGPVMTVNKIDLTSLQCQWFGGKKLEHGYFDPKAVRLATAEDIAAGQKK